MDPAFVGESCVFYVLTGKQFLVAHRRMRKGLQKMQSIFLPQLSRRLCEGKTWLAILNAKDYDATSSRRRNAVKPHTCASAKRSTC